MKTPERTPQRTTEEIKRGLETCIGECRANKPHCPYHTCGNGCMDTMNRDALALIQQFEQELVAVKRERDAACITIKQMAEELDTPACEWCKGNLFDTFDAACKECRMHNEGFEWRGVSPDTEVLPND